VSTAILVTARLKSIRLPRKVLKPILGRPMLSHLLDRLKEARRPERIIICTSPLEEDRPLVALAAEEGVDCFQGDPDDVLLRLTTAAQRFGVDTVVSCTADNPFVDAEYIDRLVSFHQERDLDYSITEGLPFGCFAYVLSRRAMERACEIKAESDTEVWGGYFTQTGRFACGTLPVDEDVRWPDLRLTVDTPEDFALVTRIFEELYVPGEVFPLRAIINLCRSRPDLVALNAQVQQKAARPIKVKRAGRSESA